MRGLRKKSKKFEKEGIFVYKVAKNIKRSAKRSTRGVIQRNFNSGLPGKNMLDKHNGYVSMYGRELKCSGFQSRSSQRTEYSETGFRTFNKPMITSHRKNVSYTFSRVESDKFKKAALNHYDDGYVIKSAICYKNLSSSKRPRNYRTERNNSTEGYRNHSVYHFKNNYFSNLSQANSEFINPVSQRTEDGKIIHDVDIIAEKMIVTLHDTKKPQSRSLYHSLDSKSRRSSLTKRVTTKNDARERHNTFMKHKNHQIQLSKLWKDKLVQANRK
ncbi:unnamed protein product [Moneuplotes crassus]|uniref:Uncharacterized protein n=1 Tax=Euplotes crassus TaxID=5936 RepID=A0AAD1TZZ7_EUPCR|nr:unnamed protein product [Moneuplotes crassus]